MIETPLTAAVEAPTRTPRGYIPNLAISTLGIYLGTLTPLFGGLSVKIQTIVGIDDAPTQLGLVTGVGAIFAMVVQPFAGRLSDRSMSRFGRRRPFLLVGTLGMVACLFGVAAAESIPLLLLGWCGVQFFANIAFAALTATIADQVPEDKRGAASGVYGAASPAGILLGSILLSILPTDFLRFAVPSLITLAVGLWFTFTLRDRVRAYPPTDKLTVLGFLSSFVFNPRKNPDMGWAWITKFLVLLGYGGVSGYLTLYLGARYGMNVKEQLAFNALGQLVSIGALVVFSVIGGIVSDRLHGRRKGFLVISGLLVAAGTLIVALAPFITDSSGPLYLGLLVIGIGGGFFFAVDQAVCIALLPNTETFAKDLGVLNVANGLAQSIAPFVAGVVFIPLGARIFGDGYQTWFIVSAVIAAVGSLLVFRIKKKV